MPALPSAVRAALGLAATVLDEAKTLPDKAIELPMLAISKTLQLSLRAQRQYAALAARGDEVLGARNITDTPPPWAKFDEPADDVVTELPVRAADAPTRPAKSVNRPRARKPSAFDRAGDD